MGELQYLFLRILPKEGMMNESLTDRSTAALQSFGCRAMPVSEILVKRSHTKHVYFLFGEVAPFSAG